MSLSWTKSAINILEKEFLNNFIRIGNISNLHEIDQDLQRKNYPINTTVDSWYAIHTRRHYENVIMEILNAKGVEAYVPMLEERRRWTHRTKVLKVPLFTNYTFARFNLNKRIDILCIKGVIQIVGTRCGPSRIPDAQIEAIRIITDSKLKKDPYPFLVEGMHVRVKRGPLKGQEGVLLHKGHMYRFVVCLPVLGQSIGVEIDASALECI